ncbi:hypothetical protein [Flavobacterium aquidurense]|uniref:hypothetical protein n=2 Tax=Flavobacterium aquidurense TaxID=362413 RepID=UPI003757DEB8
MKVSSVYYIIVIAIFSIKSFGQDLNISSVKTTGNSASMPENISNNDPIIGYLVVETINKTFGRSVTQYKVSRLSMISTYDLGPNNTRTITPIYGEVKGKNSRLTLAPKAPVDTAVAAAKPIRLDAIYRRSKEKTSYGEADSTVVVNSELTNGSSNEKKEEVKPQSKALAATASKAIKTDLTDTKAKVVKTGLQSKNVIAATATAVKLVEVELTAPADGGPKSLSIDVVKTYAKVLDKGYKSIEMLTKVGDRAYFDGDLATAAKYYSELFSMAKNLEPVYYYRYAQSLKAINQMDKADEMMKLFENKK